MGVWLLQPSVQFFGAIPNWLSLQKLILLAFGGIGAGIALSLVCWKGPYIQKLFGNRWVGIGLVLIVHRILLLV